MNSVDPATWVDVISAASPVLSALIAVVGVLATLWFTNRREEQRQDHERELQLNEARREAYANLSKLTKGMNIENPEAVSEVREAHAQVEILSGDPELLDAADKLVMTWTGAWDSARNAYDEGDPFPFETPGYKNAENLQPSLRAKFLDRARDELQVKGRSAGARELEGSPPGDALPGPETAASRPWWRRWFGT